MATEIPGQPWWKDKPLEEQVRLLEHFLGRERVRREELARRMGLVTQAITPGYQRDPSTAGVAPEDGESWAAWAAHPAIHPLIEALLDVSSGFNNAIHRGPSTRFADLDLDTARRAASFWYGEAERYARNSATGYDAVCRRWCERAKDDPSHHPGDGGCVFLDVDDAGSVRRPA